MLIPKSYKAFNVIYPITLVHPKYPIFNLVMAMFQGHRPLFYRFKQIFTIHHFYTIQTRGLKYIIQDNYYNTYQV